MHSIRLTTKQSKDSFLQVLFLIDPITRTLRFSNQLLGFEYTQDNAGIPSFVRLANEDQLGEFKQYWEKCLLVAPGNNCRFEFPVKNQDGVVIMGNFEAVSIELSRDPGHYVLFSITDANATSQGAKKPEDPYKHDYTEFVNLASHDLDSPMRKLSTFLDRLKIKLRDSGQSENVEDYLARIDNSVKDMRTMIDSLALLSSMDGLLPQYENCNVTKILGEVVKSLEPALSEKKAELTYENLPMIEADPNQLKILLHHLVDNAVKFSKPGVAAKINITTAEITEKEKALPGLAAADHYYKLEINDNGIGFKEQEGEKIFSAFQRLNGKSQFAGSGIGLAVCRKIAENHKGFIYAEGIENSGARFILILPQITHHKC